jgi:hypothetical protein
MNKKQYIFKIVFIQRDNIFEIYAKQVSESDMYGFVVVEDILFGARSAVLVDPSEEKVRAQFQDVTRTYIPIHAILRIDEVEKQGTPKVTPFSGQPRSNVSIFPGAHREIEE